jgi:asparagine synthase (glutamine-hydrolysing)
LRFIADDSFSMCGIAGLIDFQRGVKEQVVREMGRCLAQRGPDEGHVWVGGPCGLAHQRLRVIDLSPNAAQPMSNEDGRLRLVFNGEIYNFQQLREELAAEGHCFRSRSDTEVILHGYEKWGREVFAKLRGMFAVAIWDERNQCLVLGRDRLGKKPLFYARGEEWVAFGSELDVFRHVPFLKLTLCGEALREYVEYGYVNDPRTILKEVQRLSPGHCALWKRSGWQVETFWRLPLEPPAARHSGGPAEAAVTLEPALREAVTCRLVSDVPLGCFLSGGVDSSLVAALAQESMSGKLKTYSVGFAESDLSEAAHAAAVARQLGTDHHELMVRPAEVLSEFESVLSKLSEPLGDDSFVPTHLISRETRRHVTVVLTGDGGDELFCGYTKYRQFEAARRLPRWLRGAVGWLRRAAPGDKVRKSLEALSAGNDLELARWLSSLWKRDEIDGLTQALKESLVISH